MKTNAKRGKEGGNGGLTNIATSRLFYCYFYQSTTHTHTRAHARTLLGYVVFVWAI